MYVSRTKSRALREVVRQRHFKHLRVDNQVACAIVVFAARQATDSEQLKELIKQILDEHNARGARVAVASLLKSGIDKFGSSTAPILAGSSSVQYDIDEVIQTRRRKKHNGNKR
ncbi:hypothetical protein PF003_g27448 [Phytophthora fragariae]|nr:hypothetical protein PF003_g27448 [Phytophthora fragariae]